MFCRYEHDLACLIHLHFYNTMNQNNTMRYNHSNNNNKKKKHKEIKK